MDIRRSADLETIDGWCCYWRKEVSSTNDEIKKYCSDNGSKIVLCAEKQTAGRGRRGHSWLSLSGNLFFSMAFEFDIRNAGKIAIISGLSLLQVIKQLKENANVLLKWPNDVLLNNAKVSGILLEKGCGNYLIVGIGVNIAQSPISNELCYQVTSLSEAGIDIEKNAFLKHYIKFFLQNLSLLQTQGFAVLREKWLRNAKGLEQEIIVRQDGKEKKGIFKGIDENAALLMATSHGIEKIMAGDVFFEE